MFSYCRCHRYRQPLDEPVQVSCASSCTINAPRKLCGVVRDRGTHHVHNDACGRTIVIIGVSNKESTADCRCIVGHNQAVLNAVRPLKISQTTTV